MHSILAFVLLLALTLMDLSQSLAPPPCKVYPKLIGSNVDHTYGEMMDFFQAPGSTTQYAVVIGNTKDENVVGSPGFSSLTGFVSMHTGEEMDILWLKSFLSLIPTAAVSFSLDGGIVVVISRDVSPTKIIVMRTIDGEVLRYYEFDNCY